jgi:predicted O-linked N-acetylglucosamine transferase (SPINDLY family)
MADADDKPADILKRALAAFQSGDLEAARRMAAGVLADRPDDVNALHLTGLIAARGGRLEEAERAIARAVAVNPAFAAAHISLGHVLAQRGRPEAAGESYGRALLLRPNHAGAHFWRGSLRRGLNRLAEALEDFERAVALDPGHAEAWNNRGVVLKALGRMDDAIASYGRALEARADFVEAAANRGLALAESNRHREAIGDFERALKINPGAEYVPGLLAHSRMHCCDWRQLEADRRLLTEGIRAGKRVTHPFPFLALSDSAEDQLACARLWAAAKCPPAPQALWRGEIYRHEKIRVAYLSADFHDHATAYLAAGMFERHDRGRFETAAFSFGPDAPGPVRERLLAAFGRFHDVRRESDEAVAGMIRGGEFDIAVDLKGFTKDARSRIPAFRPAPVQVSYLGFPGTMGSGLIDYILADTITIPEGAERHYAEQVVRLPGSYQPNDRTRAIAEETPTRAEAGLPERGFVFASFNSVYKITPEIFAPWMRLLARTEGSVLWLLGGNAEAEANLKRAAEARGVASARLVFAGHIPVERHLARQRLADLFLDTLPCNAHTTASDALWAGLPVLTCPGGAFATRVAASLVTAAGLPELAAKSLEEYEALALRLASDPSALAAVKARLVDGRLRCALFDTERHVRAVERAYTEMVDRSRRGEKPRGFAVEP